MDPRVWGKNLWISLINIAKGYPESPDEKTMQRYTIFFHSLAYVLPCPSCQKNYQMHLKNYPVQLQDRTSLLKWLHQINNLTLVQTKRKERSFDSFLEKYSSVEIPKISLILLVLVLIAVGYYYFVYKKGKFPFSLGK